MRNVSRLFTPPVRLRTSSRAIGEDGSKPKPNHNPNPNANTKPNPKERNQGKKLRKKGEKRTFQIRTPKPHRSACNNPTNCARWQFVVNNVISLIFIAQHVIDKKFPVGCLVYSKDVSRDTETGFNQFWGREGRGCFTVLKTLTLFQIKIYDFSDLTPKIYTLLQNLFQTSSALFSLRRIRTNTNTIPEFSSDAAQATPSWNWFQFAQCAT